MLKNKKLLPNLRTALEVIKNVLNKNCGTLPSLPHIYKMKQNIILSEVIVILQKAGYTILKQVLNYNGKVIGVFVCGCS